MSRTFDKHCPLYHVVLWCSFFFILPAWATLRRGHHYWIIFKHKVRWLPKRSFICLDPLLSTFEDHCANPQLCLSILNGQYTHCELISEIVYAFDHLSTQLTLVGLKVKMQTLESIMDLFKHRDFLGLHFGHRRLTHFGCANGFLGLYHTFFRWNFISRHGAYQWFFFLGRCSSCIEHFVFMCHS
jgi:hypothetical protein